MQSSMSSSEEHILMSPRTPSNAISGQICPNKASPESMEEFQDSCTAGAEERMEENPSTPKAVRRVSFDVNTKLEGTSPMPKSPYTRLTAIRIEKVIRELDHEEGSSFEAIHGKLQATGLNIDPAVVRSAIGRALDAGLIRENRKMKLFCLPHCYNTRLNSGRTNAKIGEFEMENASRVARKERPPSPSISSTHLPSQMLTTTRQHISVPMAIPEVDMEDEESSIDDSDSDDEYEPCSSYDDNEMMMEDFADDGNED